MVLPTYQQTLYMHCVSANQAIRETNLIIVPYLKYSGGFEIGRCLGLNIVKGKER